MYHLVNMDAALQMLPADERILIEVVRDIKRFGYGEFQGVVTGKEIVTVKEGYTHKLK